MNFVRAITTSIRPCLRRWRRSPRRVAAQTAADTLAAQRRRWASTLPRARTQAIIDLCRTSDNFCLLDAMKRKSNLLETEGESNTAPSAMYHRRVQVRRARRCDLQPMRNRIAAPRKCRRRRCACRCPQATIDSRRLATSIPSSPPPPPPPPCSDPTSHQASSREAARRAPLTMPRAASRPYCCAGGDVASRVRRRARWRLLATHRAQHEAAHPANNEARRRRVVISSWCQLKKKNRPNRERR